MRKVGIFGSYKSIAEYFGIVMLATLASSMAAQATDASGPVASAASPPASKVVPPPLSRPLRQYFKARPQEFQKLLQRMPRMKSSSPSSTSRAAVAIPAAASPGTWRPVATTAPEEGISNPLLMTDGTVIVHVLESTHWYKLTPDNTGNYANGTWSQIASLPNNYSPLYFGSQVLNDGKVIINGGEYDLSIDSKGGQVESSNGAIYTPGKNVWTYVKPPLGWGQIGDAVSVLLPNGTYMLADCCSTAEALLSGYPAMTWKTTGSGKHDVNDEEGWAKLANGMILTADGYVETNSCGKATEIYDPSTGAWASAGNATTQMSDCSGNSTGYGFPSYEVGPILATPHLNNVAIAFSGVATGVPAGTSFYNPFYKTWNAGANVPAVGGQNYTLADAPAVVLPNGNILFAASPNLFQNPVHHFELSFNDSFYFQNITNTGTAQPESFTQVGDTPNSPNNTSFQENMLLLPTGEVLSTDFSNAAYIYTPTSTAPFSSIYTTAIPPTISSVPTGLTRAQDYLLQGAQLCGRSHGNYGDDVQSDTNFPLVLIVNNATGHKFFARTHNFSSRSIAENQTSTANFTVDFHTETGPSTLYAIANGVQSAGVAVTIY